MENVFDFIRQLALMGYIKINVDFKMIEQQWSEECRINRHKTLKRSADKYSRSSNNVI